MQQPRPGRRPRRRVGAEPGVQPRLGRQRRQRPLARGVRPQAQPAGQRGAPGRVAGSGGDDGGQRPRDEGRRRRTNGPPGVEVVEQDGHRVGVAAGGGLLGEQAAGQPARPRRRQGAQPLLPGPPRLVGRLLPRLRPAGQLAGGVGEEDQFGAALGCRSGVLASGGGEPPGCFHRGHDCPRSPADQPQQRLARQQGGDGVGQRREAGRVGRGLAQQQTQQVPAQPGTQGLVGGDPRQA